MFYILIKNDDSCGNMMFKTNTRRRLKHILKGHSSDFSFSVSYSRGVWEKQITKRNVKIGAAEAEISWFLVSSMSQTPKKSGSYISHNATWQHLSLDHFTSHLLYLQLQVLAKTFCYKCQVSIIDNLDWHHYDIMIFTQAYLQSHSTRYTAVFRGWVGVFNMSCKISGVPL